MHLRKVDENYVNTYNGIWLNFRYLIAIKSAIVYVWGKIYGSIDLVNPEWLTSVDCPTYPIYHWSTRLWPLRAVGSYSISYWVRPLMRITRKGFMRMLFYFILITNIIFHDHLLLSQGALNRRYIERLPSYVTAPRTAPAVLFRNNSGIKGGLRV